MQIESSRCRTSSGRNFRSIMSIPVHAATKTSNLKQYDDKTADGIQDQLKLAIMNGPLDPGGIENHFFHSEFTSSTSKMYMYHIMIHVYASL